MGRGSGVRATADGTVQIDFRYKGVRCRERLKLAPTPANLKYAARLKATIEHEIATNVFEYGKHFPGSARAVFGKPQSRDLREALQGYVDSLSKSVEPETARDYGRDAEILAGWFGAEATLEGLTRKDIRQAISRQTLSKQRIDNMLRPLRGALEQALEDGVISENPMHGFKVRRVSDEPGEEAIDPFTPEEIEALGRSTCGDLWTFWAWTGMRSGEIIGLRWGDVSEACDQVSIRRAVRLGREKRTKTKAGTRKLALLPAAKAVIASKPRGDAGDPVFTNPNTGRHWHEAKALNREFGRACKACGVRYRYSYQLRHTYATWALSSGENPMWVAASMGHKDTTIIFRHYGKWMPGLDAQAGSRMVKAAKPKPKLRVA